MGTGGGPRWRIVVDPAHRDLHAELSRIFEPSADVEVTLDRRGTERREREVPRDADLRHIDRRRPVASRGREIWRKAGFQLVDTGAARDRELRELLEAALRLLPPAPPAG
jgi:hypothetical protein